MFRNQLNLRLKYLIDGMRLILRPYAKKLIFDESRANENRSNVCASTGGRMDVT